jgi:hypothetical protein
VTGGSGGERALVGARRGSEVAAEVEPEVVGTAQAAAARYLLDAERAVLEQLAGDGQALDGQPAQRRGAGFGEEPAGEGPLGHVGQAQGRPQKAPPYTLPGELVRERAAGATGTGMERLAAQGRWGS